MGVRAKMRFIRCTITATLQGWLASADGEELDRSRIGSASRVFRVVGAPRATDQADS